MDKLMELNDIGCQTVKSIPMVIVHLQYDLLIDLLKNCKHTLDYFKLLFTFKSSAISPSLDNMLKNEICEYNNLVYDNTSEFVVYDGFRCGCIDIWISYSLFRDLIDTSPLWCKNDLLTIIKESSINNELKNYFFRYA